MAVKSKKEIQASVKAEVKSWFNKETMDKIIQTLSYLPIPAAAIMAIWGVDYIAYVEAALAILISICSFIKLFLKD